MRRKRALTVAMGLVGTIATLLLTASPAAAQTVPAGTFENTITVRDFNPLDGSRGAKVYAPDVGLIVDGPLDLIDYLDLSSRSGPISTFVAGGAGALLG